MSAEQKQKSADQKYRCRICDETFARSVDLATHARKHKSKPETRAAGRSPSLESSRAAVRENGPACPTCGSDLPPFACGLARALEGEGLDSAQAIRFAALGQKVLRRG